MFIECPEKLLARPWIKSITSVFKVIYQIVQNYSKCRCFSGVNSFWTILNNEAMITKIKNSNKPDKDESRMIFDFSTLYSKIPHSKLLTELFELTDFCFDGGQLNTSV